MSDELTSNPTATLQVGDTVAYSPHLCHKHDKSSGGEPLFRFRYKKLAPGRHMQGEEVPAGQIGQIHKIGDVLMTRAGSEVYCDGPVEYWPAKVVRVNADGTADLDITHPNKFVTLHYPDRAHHPDAPGIPHDAKTKRPHSFHRQGE